MPSAEQEPPFAGTQGKKEGLSHLEKGAGNSGSV